MHKKGNYERISRQKTRLGSWEGLGQSASDASAILTALGNSIANVANVFESNKTAREQIKADSWKFFTEQENTTERLDITTTGDVNKAAIGVQAVSAQYSGVTKLVMGVSIGLAVLILVGGVSFGMVKGK